MRWLIKKIVDGDPLLFDEKVIEFLTLSVSTLKFARGTLHIREIINYSVYGIAQCIGDLFNFLCKKYFNVVMCELSKNNHGSCYRSCYVRFELFPFIFSRQTWNLCHMYKLMMNHCYAWQIKFYLFTC